MTRFLLAIGAGLLSAQAAYAQTNLPRCPTTCPVDDVLQRVCTLKMPYDPTVPFKDNPVTPMCDLSVPVSQGARDAIKNAFMLATSKAVGLQKCICALTNIFVTTDGSNSWGKWLNAQGAKQSTQYSGAAAAGANNAYISLNASDLTTTVPQQQDAHLKALNITVPGVASHSEINNSGIDSGTLAALYTIAHEMAHLSWRRDNGSFKAGCNLVKMAKSWADGSNAGAWAKRPWTKYGDMTFGKRGPPDPNNANASTLQTIYTSGVVTALGAANPEEDFVESYAMETINLATGANDTNNMYTLNITTTGNPAIAVNIKRNADVKFKFGCVDNVVK